MSTIAIKGDAPYSMTGCLGGVNLMFATAINTVDSLSSAIGTLKTQVSIIDGLEAICVSVEATCNAKEREEDKESALSFAYEKIEEFVEEVQIVDAAVGRKVRERKNDFYEDYYYLKPEDEKSKKEKIKDLVVETLESIVEVFIEIGEAIENCITAVVEWVKENWEAILKAITVALLVVASVLILVFVPGGGLLSAILLGAAKGCLIGLVTSVAINGAVNVATGRNFFEGALDAAFAGAVEGFVAGAITGAFTGCEPFLNKPASPGLFKSSAKTTLGALGRGMIVEAGATAVSSTVSNTLGYWIDNGTLEGAGEVAFKSFVTGAISGCITGGIKEGMKFRIELKHSSPKSAIGAFGRGALIGSISSGSGTAASTTAEYLMENGTLEGSADDILFAAGKEALIGGLSGGIEETLTYKASASKADAPDSNTGEVVKPADTPKLDMADSNLGDVVESTDAPKLDMSDSNLGDVVESTDAPKLDMSGSNVGDVIQSTDAPKLDMTNSNVGNMVESTDAPKLDMSGSNVGDMVESTDAPKLDMSGSNVGDVVESTDAPKIDMSGTNIGDVAKAADADIKTFQNGMGSNFVGETKSVDMAVDGLSRKDVVTFNIEQTAQTEFDVKQLPDEVFRTYETSNGGQVTVKPTTNGIAMEFDKSTADLCQITDKAPTLMQVSTKIGGEEVVSYKVVFERTDYSFEDAERMSRNVKLDGAKGSAAALGVDGESMNIHHVTSESDFTIYVPLDDTYHEQISKQLHSGIGDGDSFRNNSLLKKQFNNFKSGYWEDHLYRVLENFTGSTYDRNGNFLVMQ